MRPLNRSITRVCLAFLFLQSIVMSVCTYKIYTSSMYERYQKQMSSILDYVCAYIDNDDMSQCAQTWEESETYKEFQLFFNKIADNYSDMHYLYIIRAMEPDAEIPIREVCAANTSTYDEEDPDLFLGDGEADWYEEDVVNQFRKIQNGTEDVYYVNASQWGVDYTLVRPMIDSKGFHYGMLCIDISIDELNRSVYRNIYINIFIIIFPGLVFVTLLLLWMRLNVTDPIKQLEQSVVEFAQRSTGKRNPDELHYNAPNIVSKNEVQSLSNAVSQLSVSMKDYIKSILKTEDEKMGLMKHVTEMNTLAYHDALTNVFNKASYDKKEQALEWDILNGIAQFAIVMVDLNYLKFINDQYGHEHGNEYILGSCTLIRNVFSHSPVYRVGGDEFVVVVEGEDYLNKDQLFDDLRIGFARSTMHNETDPWYRYSAASGMAVYASGDTVESVFNRADQEMYKAKAEMRATRKS